MPGGNADSAPADWRRAQTALGMPGGAEPEGGMTGMGNGNGFCGGETAEVGWALTDGSGGAACGSGTTAPGS